MNETYYIKVNGKANIPSPLSIGHNYRIMSDCSITSETKSDNEDGTYSVTYKVEPITVEIQKDNGQTIKAKDPRSNSTKFRNSCWKVSNNHEVDTEAFYNFATIKSIGHLDMMAEEFKKLR